MTISKTKDKDAYLTPGRLVDVFALIQVLSLDEHSHRSENGLLEELQGPPISAESWNSVAKDHPEFFRVRKSGDHVVSLTARHVSEGCTGTTASALRVHIIAPSDGSRFARQASSTIREMDSLATYRCFDVGCDHCLGWRDHTDHRQDQVMTTTMRFSLSQVGNFYEQPTTRIQSI